MEPVVRDVIPLALAEATLADLADEVKAGAEKIITKDGERYVALIDANRLAYYHRLEQQRRDGLLLDGAMRGLRDVAAGRTRDAGEALAEIRQRRAMPTV